MFFKDDTLYEIPHLGGKLPPNAVKDILDVLPSDNRKSLTELLEVSGGFPDDFMVWKNKQGTFPKRLGRLLYKFDGTKVDNETLSVIGKLAQSYSTITSKHLLVEFVQTVDWRPGNFHEKTNSCWWSDYNDTRINFGKAGGYAVMLYDPHLLKLGEHVRGERGIGRCWMWIEEPPPDEEIVYYLFNAYYKQRELYLIHMARLLATHFGMNYAQVNVRKYGGYVNSKSAYALYERVDRKVGGCTFSFIRRECKGCGCMVVPHSGVYTVRGYAFCTDCADRWVADGDLFICPCGVYHSEKYCSGECITKYNKLCKKCSSNPCVCFTHKCCKCGVVNPQGRNMAVHDCRRKHEIHYICKHCEHKVQACHKCGNRCMHTYNGFLSREDIKEVHLCNECRDGRPCDECGVFTEYSLCEDCEKKFSCVDCGNSLEHDDFYNPDGNVICEYCYENYFYCEWCDTQYHKDYRWCCSTCDSCSPYHCEDCHENNDATDMDSEGEQRCPECMPPEEDE